MERQSEVIDLEERGKRRTGVDTDNFQGQEVAQGEKQSPHG